MNKPTNPQPVPVPGKWSIYAADGELISGGFPSRRACNNVIPPSAAGLYKAVLEPLDGERKLQAMFCVRRAVIDEAIRKYAASLGSDYNIELDSLYVSSESADGEVKVLGRAQSVMAIIGYVSDQGEDGLLSVVPA